MHLCMQHSWQQKTRLVLLWKPSVAALLLLIGRSSGGSGPAEVCISILCAEAGKTPLSSPVCHRVNDNSHISMIYFQFIPKILKVTCPTLLVFTTLYTPFPWTVCACYVYTRGIAILCALFGCCLCSTKLAAHLFYPSWFPISQNVFAKIPRNEWYFPQCKIFVAHPFSTTN